MTPEVQTIWIFGITAFGLIISVLKILRDSCKHKYVKSVECEVDEDDNPETTHYENTCKICGHKELHTPIQQRGKRRANKNKSSRKNSK